MKRWFGLQGTRRGERVNAGERVLNPLQMGTAPKTVTGGGMRKSGARLLGWEERKAGPGKGKKTEKRVSNCGGKSNAKAPGVGKKTMSSHRRAALVGEEKDESRGRLGAED